MDHSEPVKEFDITMEATQASPDSSPSKHSSPDSSPSKYSSPDSSPSKHSEPVKGSNRFVNWAKKTLLNSMKKLPSPRKNESKPSNDSGSNIENELPNLPGAKRKSEVSSSKAQENKTKKSKTNPKYSENQ